MKQFSEIYKIDKKILMKIDLTICEFRRMIQKYFISTYFSTELAE